MALADVIDISQRSPGVVALLGGAMALAFTALGFGIAWFWRRTVDVRRRRSP